MFGIRGDRLFDGVADHFHAHAVVLVDQGAVETLVDGRQDVVLVALGDVTLLPGLIGSHSHLILGAGNDPVGHITTSEDDVVLEHCRARGQSRPAGRGHDRARPWRPRLPHTETPRGAEGRPIGAQGVADAVAAGFDDIEHAALMTAERVHHDPDLFNVMAARCVMVSAGVASTAAQPFAASRGSRRP